MTHKALCRKTLRREPALGFSEDTGANRRKQPHMVSHSSLILKSYSQMAGGRLGPQISLFTSDMHLHQPLACATGDHFKAIDIGRVWIDENATDCGPCGKGQIGRRINL